MISIMLSQMKDNIMGIIDLPDDVIECMIRGGLENVLAGRMSDKQPSGKEGHTAAVVSNLYACT